MTGVTVFLVLNRDAVRRELPYMLVHETRASGVWHTARRKRRWQSEFSEPERRKASEIFRKAQNWSVGRGVPERVRMTPETLCLWQKLGAFCGSL